MPQADAAWAPSIRPGRSASDERALAADADHAEVRVLGRERVVGDLGRGAATAGEQRRLAGVGQADEADVGDDLQLQDDPRSSPGSPRAANSGAAVMDVAKYVAAPALAAVGDRHLLAVLEHVREQLAALDVSHHRADGDGGWSCSAPGPAVALGPSLPGLPGLAP